jgi:hypothetical protein
MKYTIYGNCQSIALAKIMAVYKNFIKQYIFIRLKPVHRMEIDDLISFKNDILPTLDLILLQPIGDNFRGGNFGTVNILEKCKNAKTILFPSMQFYGYFIGMNNLKLKNNLAAQEYVKETSGITLNELFHYDFILKSYLEGRSMIDVEKMFFSSSLYTEEFIFYELKKILNHMRKRENEFHLDIKTSNYIELNFRRKKLFYTPRHPSSELFVYVISQIMNLLNITEIDDDTVSRMHKKDPLAHISYPIPKAIEDCLSLEFEDYVFKTKVQLMNIIEMIDFYYKVYSFFDKHYLNKLVQERML